MRDAYVIIETGCVPTVAELDGMPQNLVDAILLYKAVRDTIVYGKEMKL